MNTLVDREDAPARRLSAHCVLCALIISLGLFAPGCGVTQSVTLQNVETSAPVAVPPLHLTDHSEPDQLTITPHFSWPSKQEVKGLLDIQRDAMNAPAHDSALFLWNIPAITGGMNVDVTLSHHVALGFGLSLSSLGGQTYGGWNAGFGFFNEKENEAVRFDFGVQSTPVTYTAISQIIRTYSDKQADTTTSYDTGEDSHINLYGALTLNTTHRTWPVNLFLNAYITKQQFVDFTPHFASTFFVTGDNGQISSSHWVIGLTPGVYVSFMDTMRIVLGERIIFPFNIVNQSPNPLLQFHMQIDMTI